ncbi:NAD-dependent epimerase/dehydratase family protein [Candidatus Actinomarina]|nr:NAD-dependent epimerase/dehydratase family protein [Candidatus Actinomarina sp.]
MTDYKNIFITGATGVVGKPLLQKLIDNGHNIFALTRSEETKKILSELNVTSINGDLFDSTLFEQLENFKIDAIFHVAGMNKMCSKNPDAMFHINIEGTKSMLDLGNKLGIKKFIYTSSAVTLGEEKGLPGNEDAVHRGSFLSNYEKSKYEAEVEAFKFKKDFEFVSVNPSSVQGPGRVSGTAKLLISSLNKKYPPLLKNNISIIDIDNCTTGHYNALLHGIDNERYVLNSFHVTSEELIKRVKQITNWNGSPIYIPKGLLKSAGPLFDLVALFSTGESIICRESVRVLTHGHVYDGSKAQRDLKIEYIDVDSFIHKIISWLISQDLLQLEIKNKS